MFSVVLWSLVIKLFQLKTCYYDIDYDVIDKILTKNMWACVGKTEERWRIFVIQLLPTNSYMTSENQDISGLFNVAHRHYQKLNKLFYKIN